MYGGLENFCDAGKKVGWFLERASRENGPYPTDTRNCIGRRVGLEIEYRGLFRMRRLVGLVQGWSRPPGFYELAAGDTSA